MVLETIASRGTKARELERKISELEDQLEDPDSESKLDSLIEKIRELMDEVQQDAIMDEPDMGPGGGDTMGEPGPGGPPGGAGDDMPPL
jgi:hypothetical protein